jgi:hypothetical protein
MLRLRSKSSHVAAFYFPEFADLKDNNDEDPSCCRVRACGLVLDAAAPDWLIRRCDRSPAHAMENVRLLSHEGSMRAGETKSTAGPNTPQYRFHRSTNPQCPSVPLRVVRCGLRTIPQLLGRPAQINLHLGQHPVVSQFAFPGLSFPRVCCVWRARGRASGTKWSEQASPRAPSRETSLRGAT